MSAIFMIACSKFTFEIHFVKMLSRCEQFRTGFSGVFCAKLMNPQFRTRIGFLCQLNWYCLQCAGLSPFQQVIFQIWLRCFMLYIYIYIYIYIHMRVCVQVGYIYFQVTAYFLVLHIYYHFSYMFRLIIIITILRDSVQRKENFCYSISSVTVRGDT